MLLFKKSVAYHNWFALPERPVSDARAPSVLPEYLKMHGSEQKCHQERSSVQDSRTWVKVETGLYSRSPDRSARVCNLCENGNIQDEKHVIFHVWAPNVFGTSSTIYLIIFLKVLSRVLFFNIMHS